MWKCRCSSTIFGIDGGSCVGSPSASRLALGRGARAGGCHPRGHACGDPPGKGRSAAVYPIRAHRALLPAPHPGRASHGGFRFALRGSAETAGRPGRPPSGLVRSNPSPAATGPEGGTRRLFLTLRLRVGKSEEPGFASWLGTLAGLLCMASVALDTSRVRARACAPTPGRQIARWICHKLTYPWGVGAHDVGEKPTKRRRHTPHICDRSRHNPPQSWKEPAGSPLGAGSRRRGIRTDKAA
jgi:hypothetical protein